MRLISVLLSLLAGVHAGWNPGDLMRGISLFGLETEHRGFMCDWKHPVDYYIDQISKLNFNLIRVPFSYQYVKEGNLGDLDHIVFLAQEYNITILLDFHRVWSNLQQPTPFDYGMTEQQFQDTWLFLLHRYKDSPAVKVMNAYNEYVPGDTQYLIGYTKRLFQRVEKEIPGRYIYAATGTNWSGNLRGVNLEDLPFKDRIYYSVHKYAFSGDANYKDWENSFGNIGLPAEKILIGEWGYILPHQRDWAERFISYLKEKQITNTIYWCLAHSGDTGDLYEDDCETFKWDNYDMLKRLWYANQA